MIETEVIGEKWFIRARKSAKCGGIIYLWHTQPYQLTMRCKGGAGSMSEAIFSYMVSLLGKAIV